MVVATEGLLSKMVSFQTNTWSGITQEITIKECLNNIKTEVYKPIALMLYKLVNNNKIEDYKREKTKLPSVTFSATFNKERKGYDLKYYNSLIVLDFDNLNGEKLDLLRNRLAEDPYVFAFWRSPSYNGIKGLVALDFTEEISKESFDVLHKQAFANLSNYFKDHYDVELDPTGKDITRLCFLSHDPSIVIKDNAEVFRISILDKSTIIKSRNPPMRGHTNRLDKNELFNPAGRNNPKARYKIKTIINYLKYRNLSITHSFNDWYRVAMAITNTFTYEVGIKYFISLSQLDSSKFSEDNCCRFLENCYYYNNKTINFGSIIYLAKNKGFVQKKRRGGSTEAEVFNVSQVSSPLHGFSSLARGVEIMKRLMSVSCARIWFLNLIQELSTLLRLK